MLFTMPAPKPFYGVAAVPGDKSLGHRAWLATLLGIGPCRIQGAPNNNDVNATQACVEALGVSAHRLHENEWAVMSPPQLRVPQAPLDCCNAGTAMRLLAGLLVGLNIPATLIGDASLSRRPMNRVLEPLTQMGAHINGTPHPDKPEIEVAPLTIQAISSGLRGCTYELPVASAQVKSAILLAGLFASETTTVVETIPSRDHTERLFQALGLPIAIQGQHISVSGGWQRYFWPEGSQLIVGGDPSSAAFLLGAAAITPGSWVQVPGVLLNPTRLGWVKVLQQWGVPLTIEPTGVGMGEPLGTLTAGCSMGYKAVLVGDVTLAAADIPALIDELPLLAVLAQRVKGTLTVTGAEELRHKESDRIALMHQALEAVGGHFTPLKDGFVVVGDPERVFYSPRQPLQTGHDHRVAMAMRVLNQACCPQQLWPLDDLACVAVSFPTFEPILAQLQLAGPAVLP
ncbi:MAG: 3-phosphoshikimate 1-carboxyvinyltransferase [Vampirovibrionales bacterium]